MNFLSNKTILVISPQAWGKMFVSKHHYAVELAKKGNRVYFLNPPDEKKTDRKEKILIKPSGTHENLLLIEHRLSFPYNLKFHFTGLFHSLMKSHVKEILKEINTPIDIAWSFDLGDLYPFSFFPKQSFKIFHPVDEPLNQAAINSARGAQAVFSVTQEILDKYHRSNAPKYFINHGVADYFIQTLTEHITPSLPLRVGFSGNLLREDIDRETFLQIIRENPEIIFECWGSYQVKHSNIGGAEDEQVKNFVRSLEQEQNVILHGAVNAMTLAKELNRMDAFLICYDIKKDQSKGTNYHKLMEYLGTGKVIISNNITTYKNKPELVQMIENRENNSQLPGLFKQVIGRLDYYNSPSLQSNRIRFATDNTYQKQVERIEKILANEI